MWQDKSAQAKHLIFDLIQNYLDLTEINLSCSALATKIRLTTEKLTASLQTKCIFPALGNKGTYTEGFLLEKTPPKCAHDVTHGTHSPKVGQSFASNQVQQRTKATSKNNYAYKNATEHTFYVQKDQVKGRAPTLLQPGSCSHNKRVRHGKQYRLFYSTNTKYTI